MILIIGHDASVTGAPVVLFNFIAWMKEESGEEVILLLKAGGPMLEKYRSLAKTYVWEESTARKSIFCRALNKLIDLNALRKRKTARKILNLRPRLILSNTIVNGDIIEFFSDSKIPVVCWVHELETVIRQYDKNGLSSKSLKYADHFIAASNAVRENLVDQHNIPGEKISVVNEFISPPAAINPQPKPEGFVVGGCGTLIHRKGFDLFLQVANILINKREHKDLRFVWTGGDKNSVEYLSFMKEIGLLELGKYLTITGETEDPFGYYATFDLFLMTSREDPFPLVNIEAAWFGLPVICFDKSGGSVDFIGDDSGVAVPFTDSGAMAEKVIELKNNLAEYKRLSADSKRKAASYTTAKKAPEVYAIVQKLSLK